MSRYVRAYLDFWRAMYLLWKGDLDAIASAGSAHRYQREER